MPIVIQQSAAKQHKMNKQTYLYTIASISSAILAVLLLIFLYAYIQHSEVTRPVTTPASKPFPVPLSLEGSALEAKAAVVYDPLTGRLLFAKNADTTMPLASLTKLMTAQTVLNTIPTSTLITLSSKDVSVEGDAGDWNLKVGDTMTLSNIINLG